MQSIFQKLSQSDREFFEYIFENFKHGKKDEIEKTTGLQWQTVRRKVAALRAKGLYIPFRRAAPQAVPKSKVLIDYLVKNYSTKPREALIADLKMDWPKIVSTVARLRKSGITIPPRPISNGCPPCTVEVAAENAHWEVLLSYNRQMLVKIIQHLRGTIKDLRSKENGR